MDEINEKIQEYKQNLVQIEALLEREKNNIDKIQQIEELTNLKNKLKEQIKYHTQLLAFEKEKCSLNTLPLSLLDINKSCCCMYNNSWTTGKIKNVYENKVTVSLYGYFNSENNTNIEVDLDYTLVKVNKKYVSKDLLKGYLVEAIFFLDGEWYKSKIISINIDSIEVEYIGYDTKEKIDYDCIRFTPEMRIENEKLFKEFTNVVTIKNEKEEENETFNLPDNLRINPSDNEQQRLAKRKKVKALKLNHKQKILEHVTKQKQDSWLNFKTLSGIKGLYKSPNINNFKKK
jgi:survival-of-motor-neuron-related-splicing factor 30